MCKICSKLTIKTPEQFPKYLLLLTLNIVFLVFLWTSKCLLGPLYQFINAKATHCCNYWQIYNNLSEISAHKKRLWSTVVVPKKPFYPCRLLCLIVGNSFFQSTVFLYFKKVVAAILSSADTVFFRRALARMNIVLQCTWRISLFRA